MHNIREHIMNFDWSLKSIIKAAVALVVIVVAFAIVANVLSAVSKNVLGYGGSNDGYSSNSVMQEFVGGIGGALGIETSMDSKLAVSSRGMGMLSDMAYSPESSYMPTPIVGENGSDAESYERRDYNVQYETRKFDDTCAAINGLKPKDYVVFDNSTKNETWCNYTFRVEVSHEDEVVAMLQGLDPRDFNVNTSSIERTVEYQDSELAMQQRRLESITQTLTQAETSFNSLISQATREGDTKTLSEVINNKINTLDNLNQQLLSTQDRIDRLMKNRGDQIEQIEYAHFYVSVSKITFFDAQRFTDEWKQNVQEMFTKANATLVVLTVGLVAFLLGALQFVIYGALLVLGLTIFAKIAWTVIKRIWKWEPKKGTDSSYNPPQM